MVHVKVDKAESTRDLETRASVNGRSAAILATHHKATSAGGLLTTGFGAAKIVPARLPGEDYPPVRIAVFGDGWSDASSVLGRWRRTVVLLI